MDEIVKKLAALGLPGVLLVILTAAGGSTASVIGTLTALGGPFGFGGGLFLFGLTIVLGDAISGYGIEAILKAIYTERSKTESVRFLLKEINDLPITEELKLKLKNHLSPETTTSSQAVEEPRTVEIVEE
ncbi:MAG: hypothetical protein KME28_06450 [Pelatocladus maniniholoensis HA4357-MV3]|jgi:hypothetical protein|uniref:Uncharacterized protein n=1 Tax=Pelatocladus maniniholoensis HA4357-MV3 TaxID=1117104 RepID=A0A9E3H5V7_9NOST|nr:hypothetical protein [Pelatocladus maniniholoensis HA4357-MV3]BAZ70582.1 hypothetical protein NIES4106_53770 [Fischerella sp. NIES-4106]